MLLRWIQPDDSTHQDVLTALYELGEQGHTLCFTSQNLGEFWNVCTRPLTANGLGLTPEETSARAHSFERKFLLLPDDPAVHRRWRELLVEYRVSGVQVHNARLVASMLIHRIDGILTFNTRDFLRYTGD